MSGIVDARGRPVSMAGQVVLAIVLEGTKLNFGANEELARQLPREARLKMLEEITRLLLGGR